MNAAQEGTIKVREGVVREGIFNRILRKQLAKSNQIQDYSAG